MAGVGEEKPEPLKVEGGGREEKIFLTGTIKKGGRKLYVVGGVHRGPRRGKGGRAQPRKKKGLPCGEKKGKLKKKRGKRKKKAVL